MVSHGNSVQWTIGLFDYEVDSKDCYCVDFCCVTALRRPHSDEKKEIMRKPKKMGEASDKSYELWEKILFSDATHIGLEKGEIVDQ